MVINNFSIKLVGVDGKSFPTFWSPQTHSIHAHVEPNRPYFVRVVSKVESSVCCRILVDDHSLDYLHVLEVRQVRDLGICSMQDGMERHQALRFSEDVSKRSDHSMPSISSCSGSPTSVWGGCVRVEFYEAKTEVRNDNERTSEGMLVPDCQKIHKIGPCVNDSMSTVRSKKHPSVYLKAGPILGASEIRYCTSAGLTLAGIHVASLPQRTQPTLAEVIDLTNEDDSISSIHVKTIYDLDVDMKSFSGEKVDSSENSESEDASKKSTAGRTHVKPLSSKEVALLRSMYQKRASHSSQMPNNNGQQSSKQNSTLLPSPKKASFHNQDRIGLMNEGTVSVTTNGSTASVTTNENTGDVAAGEAYWHHEKSWNFSTPRDGRCDVPKPSLQPTLISPQLYDNSTSPTSQKMTRDRLFPGHGGHCNNRSCSETLSNFSIEDNWKLNRLQYAEIFNIGHGHIAAMNLPELTFERANVTDTKGNLNHVKNTDSAREANEKEAWLGSWSESLEE